MKKISKWYWIGSLLLLLWAGRGLYDYLTIGRELLNEYPHIYSVRQMVKRDLILLCVKAGAALLLPAIGFLRSHRKPVKACTAVTLLLLFSAMGTWLISMGCLTLVTAQELYDGMYEQAEDFAESVDQYAMLDRFHAPDALENRMFHAISHGSAASYPTGGHYGAYDNSTGEARQKLIRNLRYPMETAVLFYDGAGNLLHSSGDDVLYFGYYTREEWDAGQDDASPLHFGWIDLRKGTEEDNDPYLLFRNTYAGSHSLHDFASIRVTGYFEGTRLVPVVMHYVTDGLVFQAVEGDGQSETASDGDSRNLSDLDRTGTLDWQLQLDRSAALEGRELVTVYLHRPEMWVEQAAPYVYTNGVEYESLAALAEQRDFPSWADIGYHSVDLAADGRYQLNDLLVFGGKRYLDPEETDPASAPEPALILVTAIHGDPLGCAVSALRTVYIVTGLLALALVLVARRIIRTHLLQPVQAISAAMADNWRSCDLPENAPAMWQEPAQLRSGFEAEQNRRWKTDSEITRLNTALDYARTAEENRRQMTSNIAHELKTPLAVIHSYAEGLREQIAPEKREKYLDVILSESEHTDAMVLELLDLSRLEAGRVKLSRDDFSLSALTKAVFEKLSLPAEQKKLQITCDLPDACIVTADESRIGQVVENFAANAVKYTPEGGRISVSITSDRSGVTLAVSNDCEPFSPEALQKVWDSFYRADEARSGEGTGLGLAIAKRIVELHGGTCRVRNTKTGVEFSFTI